MARLKAAGAAGARIVGGGFGGSVLALLEPGARPPDGALEVTPEPARRCFKAAEPSVRKQAP